MSLVSVPDASQNAESILHGACNPSSTQCIAYYFDVEAKLWKPLPSVAQSVEKTRSCFCAERSGNYLFVAAQTEMHEYFIHRYNVENNSWVKLPKYEKNFKVDCLCSVGDYLFAISESNPPQRYSLTNNNWQGGEALKVEERMERLKTVAVTVMNSKIYIIHGYQIFEREGRRPNWIDKPAVIHCFDPKYNVWTKLASTIHPYFGSNLFVVNNRLCVAGGMTSASYISRSCDRVSVEVYDETTNTWSVVPQKRIPPNNLRAVEIEGRVYFIINKFPVDSGIRIPPEEMYQVDLSDWENLAKVHGKAVLCYLPVKGENLNVT